MRTAESLQKTFLTFAELECKGSSELYYELAQKIALDADLLELCQAEKRGQPIPNLLFGAVHYLLLRGSDHPLKQFYPSVVAHPDQTGDAFAAFKEFCLSHQEEIEQLLQTKIVQTNEVRRCAYLYPVFSAVYEKNTKATRINRNRHKCRAAAILGQVCVCVRRWQYIWKWEVEPSANDRD